MRRLLQNSHLQYVIQHRNGYLTLACGSLVLNLLFGLTILFMIGHERIVIVPPSIQKSFWVGANQVSPEYLSEMALFFTNLRFNVTPNNSIMQRDQLLRYIHPKF